MWTKINLVFSTPHSQNCYAHLVKTNKWHKVLTGAADGVTNVYLLLCAAKSNDKQVYVALDGSGNITAIYL